MRYKEDNIYKLNNKQNIQNNLKIHKGFGSSQLGIFMSDMEDRH